MEQATVLPIIKQEAFTGPFDLLLELVRRKKIAISSVSLSAITDDFLSFVEHNDVDPSLQADFVVVAATLLLIKLHQLLPTLNETQSLELDELSERLQEYELYRRAAINIRENWEQIRLYAGVGQVSRVGSSDFNVTTEQLVQGLQRVITAIPAPVDKTRHLRRAGRTLQQCYELLRSRLSKINDILFTDAIKHEDGQTKAVSFLAILEMSRQQELHISQTSAFGPIKLRQL